MIGRRVAGSAAGALIGGAASRALPMAGCVSAGDDGAVTQRSVGAGGVTPGSFRTEEGTSGRGEGVEDDGETPTGPRRADPVAGGVLGEFEGLSAVSEECAVAMGGVEGSSRVELRQVGHELDARFSLFPG